MIFQIRRAEALAREIETGRQTHNEFGEFRDDVCDDSTAMTAAGMMKVMGTMRAVMMNTVGIVAAAAATTTALKPQPQPQLQLRPFCTSRSQQALEQERCCGLPEETRRGSRRLLLAAARL